MKYSFILLCAIAAIPACKSSSSSPNGEGGGSPDGEGGGSPDGEGGGSPDGEGGGSPDGEGGSSGGGSEISDPCCVLGAICHVTGGAEDPEIEECHILGHKNVKSVCEENFERCEAVCAGATDHAKPHSCQ